MLLSMVHLLMTHRLMWHHCPQSRGKAVLCSCCSGAGETECGWCHGTGERLVGCFGCSVGFVTLHMFNANYTECRYRSICLCSMQLQQLERTQKAVALQLVDFVQVLHNSGESVCRRGSAQTQMMLWHCSSVGSAHIKD